MVQLLFPGPRINTFLQAIYPAKSCKFDEDISFLQRLVCCDRKQPQCMPHRQYRSWAFQNKLPTTEW
ncbi:hypothetical protein CY34DRAFT_808552, partial [Suillus luteus UH-Slu-Lm8-n1]